MTAKTTLLAFTPSPVENICSKYGNKPEALLEILHTLQNDVGHVPESTLPIIAKALNLSRAEVYGVVTFYHDFHQKPQGKHTIKLCRAEACQSMGARQLQDMAETFLKTKLGGTSADGKITLEATYCLGLCASGPAIMIDGVPKARVDAASLKAAIAELQS
jgi:formate dehydrogenase subunit gamma